MEITIAYSTSEENVKYLWISASPLIQNISLNNTYRIVVLTDDISENAKEIIKSIGDGKSNIRFEFYDVKKYFPKSLQEGCFSVVTYYKFALLDVIPDTDKILYLDTDTIVMNDVAEMFATDVNGVYFAGVRDTAMFYGKENFLSLKKYYESEFGINNPANCINAGVLVMNLLELRKDYSMEKLIDIALSHRGRCFDQDVLNMIAHDKVRILSRKYNFFPDVDYENFISEDEIRDHKEASKNPVVIHYICSVKWNKISNRYSFYFWEKALGSPGAEEIWKKLCDYNDYLINDMGLNELRVLNGIYDGKVGVKFCLRCVKAMVIRFLRRTKSEKSAKKVLESAGE